MLHAKQRCVKNVSCTTNHKRRLFVIVVSLEERPVVDLQISALSRYV